MVIEGGALLPWQYIISFTGYSIFRYRFAMKLVVRFREVKIQSKKTHPPGLGRPQTHGGELTGWLSKTGST
jgi:hypothetical protein